MEKTWLGKNWGEKDQVEKLPKGEIIRVKKTGVEIPGSKIP